jgi:hypothetical protein
MRFAGVVSVIPSVARVTAGSVSVMGGFLVLPAFMMLGCFVMMTSGLAVFGSFFRHADLPVIERWAEKLPARLFRMGKVPA